MTPKQQLFVQEFMIDMNASAAARRAGYSLHTADVIGVENLGKPAIASAIAAAQQAKAESIGRSVAAVMADIGRVRDNAMELLQDLNTNSQAMRSHKDALKALELEGKHLGAFVDRVQLSNPPGESLSLRVAFEAPTVAAAPGAID